MSAVVQSRQYLPLAARSMDEAREPLSVLFAAYPEPWVNREAKEAQALIGAKVNAYLLAVQGIPGWAIEQAVKDFIQARVERKRRGVLPTAEEIASQAREHVEAEHIKQRHEAQLREQMEERKREREREEWLKTPEGQAEKKKQAERMAQIMGRLRTVSVEEE